MDYSFKTCVRNVDFFFLPGLSFSSFPLVLTQLLINPCSNLCLELFNLSMLQFTEHISVITLEKGYPVLFWLFMFWLLHTVRNDLKVLSNSLSYNFFFKKRKSILRKRKMFFFITILTILSLSFFYNNGIRQYCFSGKCANMLTMF